MAFWRGRSEENKREEGRKSIRSNFTCEHLSLRAITDNIRRGERGEGNREWGEER